ncbi:MAG: hypothetical protein K2P63_08145 [Lachnospiraceae bacterium]|nr:hypothetical protein [Lachnospiraceae bacterium]
MGVFWHVAVFKKQNKVDVWEVVRQLAEGDNEMEIVPQECAVYECESGTCLMLNAFCLAFDRAAKTLSQILEGPVLVCDIYDDDYWDYFLYKDGRELDKFMTVPDYFEELADEEWEQWRGDAALLAQEFCCAEKPLSGYLRFWGEDGGDTWEVVYFLEALGFEIPDDAGTDVEDPEEDVPDADLQGSYAGAGRIAEEDWDDADSDTAWTAGTGWRQSSIIGRYFTEASQVNPVSLTQDVKVDPDVTQWVRVCEGGVMQQFPGADLTSERIVALMDETLGGRYSYFAADFVFQGEGVYVKKLKKKVYRPFHSTLVLHQGCGNLACLFFAGDSMCCYRLIGDINAYCNVECENLRMFPVGDVLLEEDIVFQERSMIDRALFLLFSDLENADKCLEKSALWSAQVAFPGGINNYNRRRRELGLLAD